MTLLEKKKFVDSIVGDYRLETDLKFKQECKQLYKQMYGRESPDKSTSSWLEERFSNLGMPRVSTAPADWKVFYIPDKNEFRAEYKGSLLVAGSYSDLENTTQDLETLNRHVLKETALLKIIDTSNLGSSSFLIKAGIISAMGVGASVLFSHSNYVQGLDELNRLVVGGIAGAAIGAGCWGVIELPQYLQHLYVASKLSQDAVSYSTGIDSFCKVIYEDLGLKGRVPPPPIAE